jgi:hypothetical protein
LKKIKNIRFIRIIIINYPFHDIYNSHSVVTKTRKHEKKIKLKNNLIIKYKDNETRDQKKQSIKNIKIYQHYYNSVTVV